MQAAIFIEQSYERLLLMQGLQQMGIAVQAVADTASLAASGVAASVDLVVLALTADQLQAAVQQIRCHTRVPLLVIAEVKTEAERRALYAAGVEWVFVRPYSLCLLLLQAGMLIYSLAG